MLFLHQPVGSADIFTNNSSVFSYFMTEDDPVDDGATTSSLKSSKKRLWSDKQLHQLKQNFVLGQAKIGRTSVDPLFIETFIFPVSVLY